MYLVTLLLPLNDNEGRAYPPGTFSSIRSELTERFGGLTAYTNAPAEGEWAADDGGAHEDIVVIEVMAEALDRGFWQRLRQRLEAELCQKEILIRVSPIMKI